MRVLFDQGTPVPLQKSLSAYELGWSEPTNSELLASAEDEGYEVLVTTDTKLEDQQNLADRKIAIVVLKSTSWPRIQRVIPAVVAAIEAASPGSCTEVEIP